jgi:hypothetical protein
MCDVYKNTHLALVAVSSSNDAEGFQGSHKHLPTELAIALTNPQQETRVVIGRHSYSGPPEPLYARAWTYQERSLFPGMIICKQQELSLMCKVLLKKSAVTVSSVARIRVLASPHQLRQLIEEYRPGPVFGVKLNPRHSLAEPTLP